ncbi:MAG: alpha-N-arabinofuranosidase, partial [Candidatus Ornithomonoglobus sp.]
KDVMIYHCRNYKEIDGDPLYDPNRHAYAKVIEYDEEGFPIFGEPVPDNQL